MKEFKIDTWWKKLLIYLCMIQAALFVVVMGLAIMFSVVSLFQTTENIDYEEFDYKVEVPLLDIQVAEDSCLRLCDDMGGYSYEIMEDVEGSFWCDCYDEEKELIGTGKIYS